MIRGHRTMKSRLFVLSVASLLQGLHSAQWSSTSPQDGDVKYVCKGGSVTLPWKYILSSGDVLGDIQWLYDGNSQELVAFSAHGQFATLPAFANRVQAVDNAGITVSHLTVADSGNYTVEINLYGDSGAHSNLRRTVFVQVSDHLMTLDGYIHVTQRSEVVLDKTTEQWSVQLQCGTFTFRGDPPFQVEWITPSGAVVNSCDFSDNHFNLLLTNPVQGGNYTCRVPPRHAADACLHGNGAGHVQASVYVGRVDARLSLLEKENEQVKEENKRLQNRVQGLEDRTRQQIGFHATGLQSETPPSGAPLIVNTVHYNHGNAYSGTTGYFTAPYPGVYFFAATTGSGRSGDIAYHSLFVDNTELSQAFTHEDSGTSGVSTVHAVVHLTTGQRVWVRSHGDYYNYYTSFSGFLISSDP